MKTFRQVTEEWSKKYKDSIDCNNPKGFSQKAHCLGRKKSLKEQFKPYKTPEEIAKKHKVDVSFIEKQLELGKKVEKEHTKSTSLATKIALQHLEEIPDYYTRLKKVEVKAKLKEHCGCEYKAVEELEEKLKVLDNTSYESIDKLMRRIMKKHDMTARQLHDAFVEKNKKTPDDWIKDLKEGTLHHWFKGSKSKDGKPGWVQADGSPCANEPGETKTPKCFSSDRLNKLKERGKKGESLIRSAIRRKREKDKKQQEKTGASKPTYVPTFAKGKKDPNYIKAEPGLKESVNLKEEGKKDIPGKGSGKKDACYHKVKSRVKVWPSAYASGQLVQCRKKGAKNWGKSKVSEGFEQIQNRGMIYSILLRWNGKNILTQIFFPQFKKPTKKDITFEIRKIYPNAMVISFLPSVKNSTLPLIYVNEPR